MEDKQYNEFRLQELITRREGMIAENQGRIHDGNQVAYQEDSFAVLADEIRRFAEER
jgi:hypothetical protein